MKKIFFILIIVFPIIAYPKLIVLKRGDTLSELLQKHGLEPIYGKGNSLEECLELNSISLKQARKLEVGTKVLLAPLKKTDVIDQEESIAETNKQKIYYGLQIGSSSFQFEDTNYNQATFNSAYQLGLILSARTDLNFDSSTSFLLKILNTKLAEVHEIEYSEDSLNLWSLFVNYHHEAWGLEYFVGIGYDQFFLPLSTTARSVNFTSGQNYALKTGINHLGSNRSLGVDFLYYFSSKNSEFTLERAYGVDLNFFSHSNKEQHLFWNSSLSYKSIQTDIVSGNIIGLFVNLFLY
jgi:hypothetical protein